jgi:serine/threonine protein kinase
VPDQRERVSQLYAEALSHQGTARADFLRQACGGDESLRVEVESLLAHAGAPLSVLDVPVAAWAAGALQDDEESFIGRSVGPYRILSTLGAGGMGDVYRARDTKLGRDVAIKILSRIFTTDADRRARFDREARILASLNHPHIAAIYGVEESVDGIRALVLELVEGETLANRLDRGPVPVAEALDIARQISDALEAAHESGIVHRDLKPANIKITPDGVVKVLDFGLAKASVRDGSTPDLSQSPTMTIGSTGEGIVLGTAAYMSPEQARGKPVDKRTDIWAFGCVLYEMLTGQLAFKGETVSDTISAVLTGAPEWDRLPSATPANLCVLLQRCLEKDLKRRLRDIGDARLEIEHQLDTGFPQRKAVPIEGEVPRAASTTDPTPRSDDRNHTYQALGLIGFVLVLIAVGVGLFDLSKSSLPVTSPAEYSQITNFTDSATAPSLSPDGRMVTFIRGGEFFYSPGQIYVKLLPNGESVQLTNHRGRKSAPVFTPDGSRIAYTNVTTAGDAFLWDTWTVPVLGGQPKRFLPNASGLTWITDQRVLFSEIMAGTGFHMGIVTATEGRADSREVYFPPHQLGMAHFSYASPDRQSVLVVEMDQTHNFHLPCRLLPFDGSSAGRRVGPQGTCTSAAWSPDGKWMYFAARVRGSAHLWRQKSPNGVPEQITFGPTEEEGITLAPDGRSLVTSVGNRRSVIWIHDAAGERAISSEGYAAAPRLSRDGSHVFYLFVRDLMSKAGNWVPSSAELRSVDLASGKSDSVLPGVSVMDYDMSRDETEVAFTTIDNDESQIWLASLDRRTPPRRIARGADEVSFGVNGDLVFRSLDEKMDTLVRIRKDGSRREPLTTVPILEKGSVSPDGEWVTAINASGLISVPLQLGAIRRICPSPCRAVWSSDGRFFYVAIDPNSSAAAPGMTLAIPVPAGKSLPDLPASGIVISAGGTYPPGTRVIEHGSLSPGPEPSTYAFTKTDLQRNLFRIPLHY